MKVRYTRSSLAQLNKILAHIEEHSPQGVRNVQARIQEVIALIAALLGFGGIAGSFVGVAKILFIVFLILAVLSFLGGGFTRGRFWG